MKKVVFLALTVTILLFCAAVTIGAASTTTSNLVQNGSFENGPLTGPTFWQTEVWDKSPNATEYKYESGNAHSGSKFVTIINHSSNDARYKQDVNVGENKIYRLSCWIKATNIPKDHKGANISIESKLETSPDIWETNGKWQLAEMYARTGQGITVIPVTVGIGTYGSTNTGRASFDDVTIEEVSSIPGSAVVCELNPPKQQTGSDNNSGNGNANSSNNGNSFTSIIGYILIAGIFIIIIGFILYRSVTNKSSQGKQTTDGDAETESKPDHDSVQKAETHEPKTDKSDDLL